MTPDEIKETVNINYEIVKEAHDQVEKKMAHVLKAKDSTDVKLFSLFNAYMPTLVAAFGSCIFFIQQKNWPFLSFLAPLTIFLLVSIMYFLSAFDSGDHGSIGSDPDFWLQKDTISAANDVLSIKTALLVHSYQEAIKASMKSNDNKIRLRKTGIRISIMGLIISSIIFLFNPQFFRLVHTSCLSGCPLSLSAALLILVLLVCLVCHFSVKWRG